jgi:hypothetical protein
MILFRSFIALMIATLVIIEGARFEKNYRFSDLQSIYYSSYHDNEANLLGFTCAIFQFTPVSDYTLLYEISTSPILQQIPTLNLYKGEMRWMPEVDIMNCFLLQPPVLGMHSFCIREIGVSSNSYLIMTNESSEYVLGLLHTPQNEDLLYSRILLYNTTSVTKKDCGFQPLLL